MEFSLKIYVTPYQKKLLEFSLGKSPFRVNLNYTIGKLIFTSFKVKENKPKVKVNKSDLIYEINIPNHWVERCGMGFIDQNQIDQFIKIQEHYFRLQLYQYINGVLDYKEYMYKKRKLVLITKMKEASLMFLEKNGFTEDDVKFETIKKGYQRYLQDTKTQIKQCG